MRIETKVGLFVFVGLIILSVGIIWKSSLFLKVSGYSIEGNFKTVSGLLTGSEVRYRGYLIGTVSEIEPNPVDIRVKLFIKKGINISEGSTLRVDFDGLIGQKYINVLPNPLGNKFIGQGDVLEGHAASGLVDFVDAGTQGMLEVNKILAVIKDIITTDESKNSLQELIININSIAKNVDSMTKKIDAVFGEREIREIAKDASSIFKGLYRIIYKIDLLISSFGGSSVSNDGQVFSVEDGDLIKDVKKIVEDTRQISERFNKSTSILSKTTLEFSADLDNLDNYGIDSKLKFGSNNLNLGLGAKGLQTIGIKDLIYAHDFGDYDFGAGMVEDSPGIRLTHKNQGPLVFQHSLINPGTWTYMFKANLLFLPNIKGILGVGTDLKSAPEVTVGVGVQTDSFF